MRPLMIGLAIFSTSSFLFAACGHDTGSAATSTVASASGTGGAPNCEGVYIIYGDKDGSEPCDVCLHDKCCPELADCRDQGCIDCVNLLLPSCGPKPRALTDCLYRDKDCQPICSPGWVPSTGSASPDAG
jgi:hypothetical protein